MLRASRAIVERPGTLPVRVGVNAGRVFAGIVGPPTRRTYTFYGDAINTAARIMVRAADGQVLAREDVLERARTTYEVTPIEPFQAKGKADLVRASDVGPAVGERELEAIGPFVGREPELDLLLGAVARARAGQGTLALIRGEPGLGKTRLIGEVKAQASGVRTIRVSCSQVSASHPYVAVGLLLRRVLQLGPRTPDGEVERRLRGAVETTSAELGPWLPLLGMVMGLDLPPTPESAALDERFVSERIAKSVESLLAGLVPDAALLVIDDVHYMDEASAELIGQIARSIESRHWLLLLARRESEGGFEPPTGGEALELRLESLAADMALLLVQQLTDNAPLPAHVADAVVARSAGSPLFVTEMIAAIERGADLDALPDSVEAMMAVQIDELESADRGLLRQASVLGTRFVRSSFVTAVELDEAQAEAALARLDRFLVSDGEGGVQFRHGLLRDAAYHGLPFRRRRQLHRRVGEAFERAGGDPAEVADQLVRHFFEAGVWAKALSYGIVAGRAARTVYANADAAALLERAVTAGRRWRGARPETVGLAAEALGDVLLSLGELERAGSAFVLAGRRVRGDPVERARLLCKEAEVGYRLGAFDAAQRVLARALALLEPVSSPRATIQRAFAEAWLGFVLLGCGRPRASLPWLGRAVVDGESVDAKEALARALAGLDRAYLALGEPERLGYGRRALSLYAELGDLVSQAGVLNNLGMAAYYGARWNEALDLYRAALEAWERAGDSQSKSLAAFNVGEILSAQGRLDEAEPYLRDAERSSRAAGGSTDVAMSIMETALLDARRGNSARALEQLAEARRAFVSAGDRAATLLADSRIAEALLLGNEPEQAAAQALEALPHAADEDGGALVLPTLHRVLGQAQLFCGRVDEGLGSLEAALADAERVGHRYEEALALDAIVRARGAGDAGMSSALRRDALFGQLGIVALSGTTNA